MADWSTNEGGYVQTVGTAAASSTGTAVTPGGTAHTKGAYAQLVASTPIAAEGIIVEINATSVSSDFLVDIALGGAGSEQIILENLLITNGPNGHCGGTFFFPIHIPAGQRLSARCQSNQTATACRVAVYLVGQGFLPASALGTVTTYGAATADTGGTQIDPGGTANTEGAWAQIIASTTRDIRGVVIALGSQANTVRTAGTWLIDLGIGAAGSEVVIVQDMYARCNQGSDTFFPPVTAYIPVVIPAGTRLAVRCQSSVIDAADRLLDVIVYGVS